MRDVRSPRVSKVDFDSKQFEKSVTVSEVNCNYVFDVCSIRVVNLTSRSKREALLRSIRHCNFRDPTMMSCF